MDPNDTIAAIATPPGEGGIGIIRISGPKALDCADQIFSAHSGEDVTDFDTYTAHYGLVREPDSAEVIDEAILVVMRAPKSYTRQDVVEIHCHGGMVPLQRILEIVTVCGVRLAEPGEFTQRAFINGRIDLSQAEAVIDLIRSQTDRSRRQAVRQLRGRLSDEIREVREPLMQVLAGIEAEIDFPDDMDSEMDRGELAGIFRKSLADVDRLLETSEKGRILREGVKTVIIGRPNVGKSSLMNLLLAENRAIVTDIPGTTRDVIEEVINIKGIPFRIIDTAGLRTTEQKVEKLGVERTRDSLAEADIVLFVVDGSLELSAEDFEIMDLLRDHKVLGIVNKIDLGVKIDEGRIMQELPDLRIIRISAKEGRGLDRLEDALYREVFGGEAGINREPLIARTRHKNALEETRLALKRALVTLEDDLPLDLVCIDIHDALKNLGEITGETVDEDLLERIFSDFCVGK